MYLAGEPFSFSSHGDGGRAEIDYPHPRQGRNSVARGNLCLAPVAERYGGGRTNLPLTRAKPARANQLITKAPIKGKALC
jgi:hypothetical protein